MENQTQEPNPILQIAWTRFAQMDAYSSRRTKNHLNFRRWLGIESASFGGGSLSFGTKNFVEALLARGIAAEAITFFCHGTTVGTNALRVSPARSEIGSSECQRTAASSASRTGSGTPSTAQPSSSHCSG
mgnify:CR=1 FL=1